MNEKSPLYRALESRGEGRTLSLDFSSRMMTEIHAVEKRRQRAGIFWSVVGYLIAVAVAGGALFYYCGGILREIVNGFSSSGADFVNNATRDITVIDTALHDGSAYDTSTLTMAIVLSAIAAVLLTVDYLLRRKLAVKFDSSINKNC